MRLSFLVPLRGYVAVGLFCLILAAMTARSDQGIAEPGQTLQKLTGELSFGEGPACDPQGNVYFTDQPNNRILKWSVEGKLTTWMQPCGRANGLCFDAAGNLWACADEKNELWSISPDKSVNVVLTNHQGKLFNGPNDLWITPAQDVYFTDPYYKRDYWKRGPSEQDQHVYFLKAGEKQARPVVEDLKQPNGIIGTPDGKTLYVADIGAGQTFRYQIERDGTLSGKKLFCSMGSDGMTIDSKGNVYLTGKGVTVFSAEGKQIDHVDVPESWTANVCFGGKDRKTLFITASKGLYALPTRFHGTGSQ